MAEAGELLTSPLTSPLLDVVEAMGEVGVGALDTHGHNRDGEPLYSIQLSATDRPKEYLEALEALGEWWEPSEEITEAATIEGTLDPSVVPEEINLTRASGLDWVLVAVFRRNRGARYMDEILLQILRVKVRLQLEDEDALQYDEGDEPWREYPHPIDDEDSLEDSWDPGDGLLDDEDDFLG